METKVFIERGVEVSDSVVQDTIAVKNQLEAKLFGAYFPHIRIFQPVGLPQATFPEEVLSGWVNLSELSEEAQRRVAIWVYNLYDLAQDTTVEDFKQDFPDLATIYFANK